MIKEKKHKKHFWGNSIWGSALYLFFFLFSPQVYSYQTTKLDTISAGCFIGAPPGVLKIQHIPLSNISDVTREILILSEEGEEIPPDLIPYELRLTPLSNFPPLAERRARVRVLYRFIDPSSTNLPPPPIETAVVEGPDPVATAFEIPSSDVSGPVLQYRIVAEKIIYQGSNVIVISTQTLPATTPQDPDPYFSVGIQANAAQIFGVDGGKFSLDDGNPADGQTSVEIPNGILNPNTTITIDQLPVNSPFIPPGLNQPVAVYRFDADPKVNGLMRVTLLYPDFEFPQGQDGLVDGTTISEKSLSIAWWDGFKWKNLGRGEILEAGTLSVPGNTISVNVTALNYLAVVVAAPLSAQDRRPSEKIITPNGDGTNDVANFTFGDRSDTTKIEIFDMGGRRLRTIMTSSALQWDGRDDSGQTVESGVYIYQYTVDGTRVSGLIAVAK